MRQMAIAVALLVSACVVEPMPDRPYNLKREASEQPKCREERPTGSMIVRRVCRTPEQIAADQAAKYSWGNRYPANPQFGDTTYPEVDVRHAKPDHGDPAYSSVPRQPEPQPAEESKTPQ